MSAADPLPGQRRGLGALLRGIWVRLTLVAAGALGAALVCTVLLVWVQVRAQGHAALDERLLRERDVFAARAAGLLRGASAGDDAAAREDLQRRLTAYLATQPGSRTHLTAIRLTDRPALFTQAGPPQVLQVARSATLPEGRLGRLSTTGSPAGDLRVLSTPVLLDGTQVAVLSVYGSLQQADHEAAALARRTAWAAMVAGLVGLVVLAAALQRSTRALRTLHRATQTIRLGDLTTGTTGTTTRVDPGVGQDEVSDLARAFNAMLARLSVQIEARTALFATVSHELRTPVAVARGHLELVQAGAAQDSEASLQLVATELGRLSRLLDDLLLLAAAQSGTFLVLAPVPLHRVVQEIRLRLLGLDLSVHVAWDAPAGLAQDAEVTVDLDRCLQAVTNLVVNAVRHTPAGTQVQVRVAAPVGVLLVSVLDDGPGIPAQVRERVFEPFVRARSPHTTGSSTGLGLSVVQAIAQAHGGSVELTCDQRGTTVQVSFGSADGQLSPALRPAAAAD